MTEPPSSAARAAFVSYAAADKATADTLTHWLEDRGIRCWIAPRDVPAGALQVADSEPGPGWVLFAKTAALDGLGRRTQADRILAQAESGPVIRVSGQYQLAELYAHRGDREGALDRLARARQMRDPGLMSYMKCDPMLAPLRSEARYKAMLTQLNLPP
jgi:hypothetical protein